MQRVIGTIGLVALAAASFGTAYVVKTARTSAEREALERPRIAYDAPDSVFLKSATLSVGSHLVAYLLVSPSCSVCKTPEVKENLGKVGRLLRQRGARFESVRIVGVSVNGSPSDGIHYLQALAPGGFDELSAGRMWRGEFLDRLTWRERIISAAVPQVIVVLKSITEASRSPLSIRYGADSIVKIVRGSGALAEWIGNDVPLDGPILLDAFAIDSTHESRPSVRRR